MKADNSIELLSWSRKKEKIAKKGNIFLQQIYWKRHNHSKRDAYVRFKFAIQKPNEVSWRQHSWNKSPTKKHIFSVDCTRHTFASQIITLKAKSQLIKEKGRIIEKEQEYEIAEFESAKDGNIEKA